MIDQLPTTDQALIQAARGFPGAHCCDGEIHACVQQVATEAAQSQADAGRCYHFDLDGRYQRLWAEFGMSAHLNEIAASGHILRTDTPEEAAEEMFRSWNLSPGHWAVASRKHTWYGAAMRQGANGVFYGAITVVDL